MTGWRALYKFREIISTFKKHETIKKNCFSKLTIFDLLKNNNGKRKMIQRWLNIYSINIKVVSFDTQKDFDKIPIAK